MRRAEFCRQGEPFAGKVHDNQPAATGLAQRLNQRQSDHARANHDRRVIYLHSSPANGMQGDGERFHQGGVLERQASGSR